jgi:hypothetical protein
MVQDNCLSSSCHFYILVSREERENKATFSLISILSNSLQSFYVMCHGPGLGHLGTFDYRGGKAHCYLPEILGLVTGRKAGNEFRVHYQSSSWKLSFNRIPETLKLHRHIL